MAVAVAAGAVADVGEGVEVFALVPGVGVAEDGDAAVAVAGADFGYEEVGGVGGWGEGSVAAEFLGGGLVGGMFWELVDWWVCFGWRGNSHSSRV